MFIKIFALSACVLVGACALSPQKFVLGYAAPEQNFDDSKDVQWEKVCPPNKAHICGLGLDLKKDGIRVQMYLVEERPGEVRTAFLMPAGSRSQAALYVASDSRQLGDLPFMQCKRDMCGGVWVPTKAEWAELRSSKIIVLEYRGDVQTSFTLPVDKLKLGLEQLTTVKGGR